jgi:hypothetical protein
VVSLVSNVITAFRAAWARHEAEASKLKRVHDLFWAVHCRRNLSQVNPFAALDGLRRVSER